MGFVESNAVRRLLSIFALSVPVGALAASPSGEHLVYTVGCVNCHHQTAKQIINAPPLIVVRSYSLPEFRKLMKTGITRTGRDLLRESSAMGIVSKEQFSHFTDDEVTAIYTYLTKEWTAARGLEEEKKIPILFKALIDKGEVSP
jgi:hypothetical protein